MPKTTIEFDVNDRRAIAGFDRLQREVQELNVGIGDTRRVSETARAGFQQVGQSAGHAAGLVDQFGRELKTTQRDTQATTGELDRLQREFRELQAELRRTQEQLSSVQRNTEHSTATTRRWGISLGSLKGVLAGLGIAAVSSEILQFARASAQASIQIDSYTRALEVLEGSALIAENRIQRLQDLADLPGLRFKDAVEGSLALKAVRVEAELATRILTELGNAAAFTGGEGEFQRGLLGLRQIVARGRISQEELNQLTENISIASTVLRNEFGTVLAEDIQKILEETGQDVNDFLETLISGFEKLERFPIDAPSVKLKNLSNSFFEFQAALGDTFLPTIAAGAQGLTALFDTLGEGVTAFNNFFDVVDERHQALLNASESAREFSIRLADINNAAGQQEAVSARIQSLYRLMAALRTEQSEVSRSSQEYLQYAERIRDANNELDTLRAIQGTGTGDNTQLINQRTEALEKTNAEIQRYTQLLANARAVAVGDTNPAIQQLERSLERNRATAAALTKEIELLQNGFQDLIPAQTTQATANYALELEKLKAAAEDTRRVFSASETNQQLTPNFQAALAASSAYYAERISQAEAALAEEKEGTDAFNALQVEIFQLGRQRLAAQRQLETERTNISRTSARERVRIEQEANNEIITGILTVVRASREALRARVEFARQIAAIPRASSPDAQYGNFTSQLRQDFQETTKNARNLADALLEVIGITNQIERLDLDARIPDPGVRQQGIDERIAAEARGAETLNDIQQQAREQGRQFLENIISSEERAVQDSLRKQARSYRQFANLVSNTFINLATGRSQSFEQVATAFIQQSLRIVLRAYVEYQIQKRLDDQLTAGKIANLRRVAAARQTAGTGVGIGNLLGNIPGIGNLGGFLSGGAGALGVAGLLFPKESSNLLGGIKDEISGFLSNVASVPDKTFGAQQVFLKIGENETREITDLQDSLREESRV